MGRVLSKFSSSFLVKTFFLLVRKQNSPQDEIVLTPSLSGIGLKTKQLTEENVDFASRHRFHQSSFVSADHMLQPAGHWLTDSNTVTNPAENPLSLPHTVSQYFLWRCKQSTLSDEPKLSVALQGNLSLFCKESVGKTRGAKQVSMIPFFKVI